MRKIQISTNFTVFVLFFGVALLEAFESNSWLKFIFWVAIVVLFLAADNLETTRRRKQ